MVAPHNTSSGDVDWDPIQLVHSILPDFRERVAIYTVVNFYSTEMRKNAVFGTVFVYEMFVSGTVYCTGIDPAGSGPSSLCMR